MSINIDDHEGFEPRELDGPVLVWDGDCGFCKRSVLRLVDEVGDRLRYVTYQSVHERFENFGENDFSQSVHLFEPDGRYFTGAEAIFRAFDKRPRGSFWLKVYERVPGFAPLAEWGYRRVANNRPLVSKVSRWLVGEDLRRPSWVVARWVFLRLLGLVGLIAFASYFVQAHGLIGSDGIIPAADYLDSLRTRLSQAGATSDVEAFLRAPSLLWLSAGDATISAVCAGGIAASAGLLVGLWPRAMLAVIWLLYLSLGSASSLFMGYQWDVLLIETSFLAIFLAPPGLWPRRSDTVSRAALFLMQWLLFRLMFMSGVVKLTSGDQTWRDLTAMSYHYMTQPLPAWTSYFAHHLPGWFHRIETFGVLALEIIVPVLLFMPRRVRRLAAILLGALQLVIMATGNYGFFNLLALALCVLCLDDEPLERILPARLVAWIRGERPERAAEGRGARLRSRVMVGVAAVLVTLSSLQMIGEFVGKRLVPRSVAGVYQPFRTINNYGLFRVMTTERPEILLEGSRDGQDWRRYDFKWKPDRLDERPGFVEPHMPRLDWQMWFAALGQCRGNGWLLEFQRRLLEGSSEVSALIEENPFPDRPPKYIRTSTWKYEFSAPHQRQETGQWWTRELVGPYCPPVTLQNGRLSRAPVPAPSADSRD